MIKRLFDIAAAFVALLVLLPVILIVAFLVRRKLGSPVFFRQARPGLNGEPFRMIKFRSMRDAVDKQGNPLPDSERITPFRRFLRSTSLNDNYRSLRPSCYCESQNGQLTDKLNLFSEVVF